MVALDEFVPEAAAGVVGAQQAEPQGAGCGERDGQGRKGGRIGARGWSIYEVSDYLGCGSYGSRVVPEVECTS